MRDSSAIGLGTRVGWRPTLKKRDTQAEVASTSLYASVTMWPPTTLEALLGKNIPDIWHESSKENEY